MATDRPVVFNIQPISEMSLGASWLHPRAVGSTLEEHRAAKEGKCSVERAQMLDFMVQSKVNWFCALEVQNARGGMVVRPS